MQHSNGLLTEADLGEGLPFEEHFFSYLFDSSKKK